MGTVILNVSHTGYGDTERVYVGLGWLVVGGERGSVAVHLVRLQVQTEKGFKRTLFTRTKTQSVERYLLGQKHNLKNATY